MKNRWIFRLYNGLVLVALPFILAGVMLRWRKRLAKGFERWPERWGHLAEEQKIKFQTGSWWWVHAVSVGEVKAIEVFLRQIPHTGARVVLSVVTPEALAWAVDKRVADEIIAAPIDLPWVARRAMRAVKPSLFISVESEFWPNLLREAKRARAKVALVNGRISSHSFRSYSRVKGIVKVLWDCFDLVCVRQHEDASRFLELGMPQKLIHVTGNLKYDIPLPAMRNGTSRSPKDPLTLVIGSSREGEEKILLPVVLKLQDRYPSLRVIWAPRHIERVEELELMLIGAGLACYRKSALAPSPSPLPGERASAARSEGIVWDTMGDLIDAYKMADVVVVGGSFVPKGGQNPLEPAALSVPVVFGPSMENFHGIAEVLVQQGGAKQVTLPELETCLSELLNLEELRSAMGRRARLAVESRQGATARTLKLLQTLV